MTKQVVPDIIDYNLDVLFCGINPGLMSAAKHHNFARPGNRFWKALHFSGFTPSLLQPADELQLLDFKLGITNFVTRPSAKAGELSVTEVRTGAQKLIKKIKVFSPEWLAVLGIDAYRTAFGIRDARLGRQSQMIGKTKVWLLPNPSGLNAHYTLNDFMNLFAELKAQVSTSSSPATTTPSATTSR